jgi:dipeptidyl aminopeptidase/acylaminoacyl peptidase
LTTSPAQDASPHVSSDGKKVVFSSTRSGSWEVWTCRADGTDFTQLTFLGDTPVGSTRWSPDSRRIAFDGQQPEGYDLYLVNEDGSGLRRLTESRFRNVKPSWSCDGRWLYFASNRTGSFQVWKMPVDGGEAVQLTWDGGFTPFESLDGRHLYYAKSPDASELWRVPVDGGDESLAVENVTHGRWIPTDRGICILNMRAATHPVIEFFEFATQKRSQLNVLPAGAVIYGGATAIAAPPDGSYLLYGQIDGQVSTVTVLTDASILATG